MTEVRNPLPEQSEIGAAIGWLAVARGTELDDVQIKVYLKQLTRAPIRPQWVVAACEEMAGEPREKGETAMPAVGDILRRAHAIAPTAGPGWSISSRRRAAPSTSRPRRGR